MEKNDIKDLINFIKKLNLSETYIKTNDIELKIVNKLPDANIALAPYEISQVASSEEVSEKADFNYIKSPMVGTFYRAPNPDSDPFVKEGSEIRKGQPLCMIEAMKIFNELASELSGKIVEILVEDASPIEYGQPLFRIETNT
jgi:acetyl-CoA carboxylase biotin carboxyl carrier protein